MCNEGLQKSSLGAEFLYQNFSSHIRHGYDSVIGDVQKLHVGTQQYECVFCSPSKLRPSKPAPSTLLVQ